MEKVVVRIAPSPTGNLHIGTARTALFNYLFAKKHGGAFVVRVEDTDKERSTKEFEENILEGMEWLGLTGDSFFRQSERGEVYKRHIEKLLSEDKAYVSQEEGEGKRSEVIRFRNPNKKITFNDVVRGDVSFDTEELKDFVIAKSVDEPLYHLAVVIDDFEMGITHVIRGEDHISNTPRQILIQEAIGALRPIYAHLPLILAPDRSKLSKRHGAVSLSEYKDKGYLPEAINNYLTLLGWNPGTEQEVFSMDELIQNFSLEKIQKGGAIFDETKLQWINKEHLKRKPEAELQEMLKTGLSETQRVKEKGWQITEEFLKKTSNVFWERAHTLKDIQETVNNGDFDFFFEKPDYKTELLYGKNTKENTEVLRHIEKVQEFIKNVEESSFFAENIKEVIWDYASQEGRGDVLWPMRVALSGKEKSPDPFSLAQILGKEETLERLEEASKKLSQ